MNGSDLLCEGVRALLRSAAGCVPAVGLGVVRRDGSAHLEVEYVDAYGATAYRAGGDAVAAAFRPGQTEHRRVEASELEAHAAGLVESRLLLTGLPDHVRTQPRVQCVVTLPTGAAEPSVLFVALAAADALTASQIDALESLAACVPDYTRPLAAAYDEVDLLRRLEAVEQLLPAFFHAHDAAGIYDRLSEIQNDVLRFDFAALGILSDDLERVDVYARTVSDAPFPESGPMPFPRVQTDAWLYRIVDDLTAHPAERDHPVVDAGGRTSIRVAVRLDDRILAALNFTSRDAAPYTAVDLAVTRRIAEYAALGADAFIATFDWGQPQRDIMRSLELFAERVVPHFADGRRLLVRRVREVALAGEENEHVAGTFTREFVHGVGNGVYYPVPQHLQKCFAYLGYQTGDLPLTEAAAAETVALPIYPELTDAQQDYVVGTIASFFKDRS